MKITARHFAGNLQFNATGVVTATWALTPLQRGRTEQDRLMVCRAHQAFYRSLVGREALLRGLMVWTDPVEVVTGMLEGIDLERHPAWAAECEATLDRLADWPMGARRWYLTVPLGVQSWRTVVRAGTAAVADGLHMPAIAPSDAEVAMYEERARHIEANLYSGFRPRRASTAELVWAMRHHQTRGYAGDIDPVAGAAVADELILSQSRAAVGEPILNEGALDDLDEKTARRPKNRIGRRVLKVTTDDNVVTYQAGAVLAAVPPQGMMMPGSEYLGRIDDCGFTGDIAVRMTIRTNQEARRRNKKAGRQLNDQATQIDQDDLRVEDLSQGLESAAALLRSYNAELKDHREVEVEQVVMVSAAATEYQDADELIDDFIEAQKGSDYGWRRPVGAQTAIWWASQPWYPISQQLRDYRHIAPARAFAAAAPLQTHQLGSNTGVLLAVNRTSMLPSPVFVDLFGDAKSDSSPAIAFTGELGSGKSYGQKRLAGDVVCRGARQVSLDSSPTGEWAHFFEKLSENLGDHRSQILDVIRPEMSMDPLRVFGVQGARAAQSFLATLLGSKPTSVEGVTIAAATKRRYVAEHQITSMGALYEHLASSKCELPVAKDVAARIAVFNDPDSWGDEGSLGQVIFDPNLPPLDLAARSIVIRTYGVELPNRDELSNEHLFEQMSIEKVFGRSFYALATRVVKEICFSNPSEPAMFNNDEFQRVTSSPEAERAATEFIRDGRKNLAAMTAGTHNGMTDLGNETLRGLFGTRIAMRHTNDRLAQASAEWLGRKDDREVIDTIMAFSPKDADNKVPADRRGEGYMVDSQGRMGIIRILEPAQEELRDAIRSTPPDAEDLAPEPTIGKQA